MANWFESLVNSDRYQTHEELDDTWRGLRALLIQIGIKRVKTTPDPDRSLRALLIQIGIKLGQKLLGVIGRLRALLIQIGIKRIPTVVVTRPV